MGALEATDGICDIVFVPVLCYPLPFVQSDLAELVEHKYGYRVLMQLLHPYCGRYLPPQLLAISRPPAKEYSAEAMQRQQTHQSAAQPPLQQLQREDAAEPALAADSDKEVG